MRKIIVLLALLALTGASAFALNVFTSHQVTMQVPEIVLLGLNSTSTITLNVVAPTNAGDPPTGETNNSKVLWYTALNTTGTHRRITVNWGGSDAAPAGTSLHVAAAVSAPAFGTTAGPVTISGTGQDIVTSIPSCATGQGANGATLNYSLVVDNTANLVVGGNKTVTVTLTLTDAS